MNGVNPLTPDVCRWSRAVASRHPGVERWASLCFLHNLLVREVEHRNFRYNSLNTLHELLTEVGRLCSSCTSHSPLEMRRLVNQVISNFELRGAPLHSAPKRTARSSTRVSRVLTAGDLVHYNLPPSLRRRYVRRGSGIERFVRDLQTDGRVRTLIYRELTGSIRGKFRCAFVTKARKLAGLQVDDALSMLGFAVVGREHWVELRYPVDFCKRGLLHTPTVLAAGDNPAFRSERPDYAGWGRAVNAHTLGSGLPEAVHGQYDISAGEGFTPVYMGKTVRRQFGDWEKLFAYGKRHR